MPAQQNAIRALQPPVRTPLALCHPLTFDSMVVMLYNTNPLRLVGQPQEY